ncbi:DUF2141 domain-containing protein [Oceanihabitans sp. 2_MG-2023]|uniref:DUF2141 domain-containing protein n=1 Tax=Oceanihabitans sp. 2_MG-2023 TaxID=3062661 RepID=UPI0026E31D41|nr:DUF2141 domain-containing protein [Oceanihabitans sp. 2_MG-2023]MDO6597724.1 DUF2141 domain-containing protein [Oceanihabitans sp. 2_MG-2023]
MNTLTKINILKSVSKSVLVVALFIASSISSQAQNENKGNTVTVTVNNIRNTNGKILSSLHDKSTFMTGKEGLQTAETIIEGNTVTITYKNVLPGEYAIMAVHDENNNKKMDFELNGMPKEHYGMSNNPILYGPPTFDLAKVEIKNEDSNITIRL